MGAISFAALGNVFRIPEIRKKLLFTFAMLALYRIGSFITVPGLDAQAIQEFFEGQGGVFGLLNLWTGGGLSNAAIFGLGIMPYITASIIMQLMTVVVPSLEKLQKEGEVGYQKINKITRQLTVVLAAMQAIGYFFLFRTQSTQGGQPILPADYELVSVAGIARMLLIVISMTAGTVLLMWIGELITQRGIGNGISLLIFASILAAFPAGWQAWINMAALPKVLLPVLILLVIAAVVFIQEGQRRIPVQYAKRMVGRRMTQGGSTYLPMRVNMAGVIPIIFATALLAFPATLVQYSQSEFITSLGNFLSPTNYSGLAIEAVMIILFTYFYTLVQFNPVDQADNLKKYGGFIPGVRPGQPTAAYLNRVLTRLTLPGALYLAILVAIPSILIREFGFAPGVAGALGGTTVLIVVGVALDSMRQMESQLVMRNYEGFLNK